MIWGVLVLIIFFLLYKMPLKFKIYYKYNGTLNKLDIIIYTFYGLIKYDIDIPSLKVKLSGKSKKGKRKGLGLNYLGHLFINEFILDIKFDSSDAAITGIIAGVLYFIERNIFLIFQKCKKVENYQVKIQPMFKQENMIDINFSCIFHFKIGQIIYERIKIILFQNLKGR